VPGLVAGRSTHEVQEQLHGLRAQPQQDPELGKVALPGVPVKFSAWPDKTEVRSARLGEDNERILHEVLKMSDEQIKKLYADGILVRDPTLS